MQRVVGFLVFLFILVLDQATKMVALDRLVLNEPVAVIPGFFNFTLVYNPGAAFGLFASWPEPYRWIALTVVSLLALLVLGWFLVVEAKGDRVAQIALTAILGGAFGNLIDRVRFDYVVDFFDFYWGTYHWPAFNIADSAICVGVAVLLLQVGFRKNGVESEGAGRSASESRGLEKGG